MNSSHQILIVEFNTVIGTYLRKILTRSGYQVIDTIPCGETAVNIADKSRPHLVLMDIDNKNQLDVLKYAVYIELSLKLPVLALTTCYPYERVDQGFLNLLHGFIIKPYREDVLLQKISHILQNDLE